MAGEPRRKQAKKAKPDPYATFRPDVALAAAISLDGAALKLWYLLHAAWRPGPKGSDNPGRAILPYTEAQKHGGIGLRGATSVCEAFRALEHHGLIRLLVAATRPGGPGGGLGLANEWQLPDRDGEPVELRLGAGISAPRGKLRLNASRIRYDVKKLASRHFKVLMYLVARLDRRDDGSLANSVPFSISQEAIATALNIPSSSVGRALAKLEESGRLVCDEPHRGRRSALWSLAPCYQHHERLAVATKSVCKPAPASGC